MVCRTMEVRETATGSRDQTVLLWNVADPGHEENRTRIRGRTNIGTGTHD
jgi:hypothetical protein